MQYMLLDYRLTSYQSLASYGWEFELTVKEKRFFGLFTQIKKITMIFPHNSSTTPDDFWKPKLNVWIKSRRRSKQYT